MEPNSKTIPQQNTQNPPEWRQDLVTDMYSDIGPINNALKSIGLNPDDLALLRSEATDFILQKTEVADFSANCFEYSSSPEEKINQFIDIVIATIEKALKEQVNTSSNPQIATNPQIQVSSSNTDESTAGSAASTPAPTTPPVPSKTLSILTETLKNSEGGAGNSIDAHRRAILDEIENPVQTVKPIDIPLPRSMPNTAEVLQQALHTSSLGLDDATVDNKNETNQAVPATMQKSNTDDGIEPSLEGIIDPFKNSQNTGETSQTDKNTQVSAAEIKSNLDSKLNSPTVSKLKESYKVADPYREQF